DEFVVAFSAPPSQAIDGLQNFFRKSFAAQLFERPVAVFDHVVQYCGHHRGLGLHPHHHSERVQDIWRSTLVTLAQVRLRRNQNRSFKGGHISHANDLSPPFAYFSDREYRSTSRPAKPNMLVIVIERVLVSSRLLVTLR